jgi:hypothetical protein
MKKIIKIDYGGLGDHLQFSTLPQAFHKLGYQTYISSQSSYRNSEIYDLVWGKNPFIVGVTDESPNCGHVGSFTFPNKDLSINRNWEILSGIVEPLNESNSAYPEIYYQPQNKTEYENALVIDINAFSLPDVYNFDKMQDFINQIIHENRFSKIYYINPNNTKYSRVNRTLNLNSDITYVNTSNIFEYCDIIYSCKHFICLWSGSSVLSSAIKHKYKQDLIISCFSNNVDKTFYWFDNIDYIKNIMNYY